MSKITTRNKPIRHRVATHLGPVSTLQTAIGAAIFQEQFKADNQRRAAEAKAIVNREESRVTLLPEHEG